MLLLTELEGKGGLHNKGRGSDTSPDNLVPGGGEELKSQFTGRKDGRRGGRK